jgi:acetyltransferase-like isoleucine patch superfamily enzyme
MTPLDRIKTAISRRATHLIYEAMLVHPLVIGPPERLKRAADALLNNATIVTNSGSVTIEAGVFFGYGVSVLAGTHNFQEFGAARRSFPESGCDIIIESGAWIASNSSIIGPCRVGVGAVVATGAVVVQDVPAYTVVAGVPAKVIKHLEPPQRTTPVDRDADAS